MILAIYILWTLQIMLKQILSIILRTKKYPYSLLGTRAWTLMTSRTQDITQDITVNKSLLREYGVFLSLT